MKVLCITILLILCDVFLQGSSTKSGKGSVPTVREEQAINVNGVLETWRLQWRAKPKPYCEPSEEAFTCPCAGFAYGEIGDLSLIRLQNNVEIERLQLTPLFTEQSGAVLQRKAADYNLDFDGWKDPGFFNDVVKRPTVKITRFFDYDHDGSATEFYLQTEAAPCGKTAGVVIGISRRNPRLHAFDTASNPTKPLYLHQRAWDALLHARSSSVGLVDWPCGDHGAETETDLELRWSAQGIDGVRREFTCPSEGEVRTLIREESLSPREDPPQLHQNSR